MNCWWSRKQATVTRKYYLVSIDLCSCLILLCFTQTHGNVSWIQKTHVLDFIQSMCYRKNIRVYFIRKVSLYFELERSSWHTLAMWKSIHLASAIRISETHPCIQTNSNPEGVSDMILNCPLMEKKAKLLWKPCDLSRWSVSFLHSFHYGLTIGVRLGNLFVGAIADGKFV